MNGFNITPYIPPNGLDEKQFKAEMADRERRLDPPFLRLWRIIKEKLGGRDDV